MVNRRQIRLSDRMHELLLQILASHHRKTLDPNVRKLHTICKAAKILPAHVSVTPSCVVLPSSSSRSYGVSCGASCTEETTEPTRSDGSTEQSTASSPDSDPRDARKHRQRFRRPAPPAPPEALG